MVCIGLEISALVVLLDNIGMGINVLVALEVKYGILFLCYVNAVTGINGMEVNV